MRYLIRFSYDGSKFKGFQRQKNVKNVQGTLESVLTKVLGVPIVIKGSGRTDALVHAVNQYAHFDYDGNITKDNIKTMNELLDSEIVIKGLKKVSNDFHARHSVKKKIYVYKMVMGKNLKKNNYEYVVPYKLDIRLMRQASKVLVGTHDFRNFVSGDRDNYETTIYKIKIYKWGNKIYYKFVGTGFYRYMVRHLVGALLDVGRGKVDMAVVQRMVQNVSYHRSLSIVPANGLYLVDVKY